jgi:hypothetical protein
VTTLSAAVIARAYADITAVDAVGGQRSDLDSGGDPTDSEAGEDAEATPDTNAEPAA